MAPEILIQNAKNYCTGADIWSFAVLVYELLTGATPFEPKLNIKNLDFLEKIKLNIKNLDYTFPNDFPILARDLIKRILVIDPH